VILIFRFWLILIFRSQKRSRAAAPAALASMPLLASAAAHQRTLLWRKWRKNWDVVNLYAVSVIGFRHNFGTFTARRMFYFLLE